MTPPGYNKRLLAEYGSLEDFPLLRNVPPELKLQVAKRICYSAEHGFCYFRIPKAANSTIVLTLAAHAHIDYRRPDSDDPEAEIRAAKKAFSDIPRMEDLAGVYCFTFVRNPYTRALSAYRDKASLKNFATRYGFLHANNPKREFTFLDFLRRLEDGVLRANPHWAPQIEIIPYELEKLDLIGRVERINEDLDRAIRAIFKVPAEIHVREHRRTGADKVLDQYLGSEEKALIQRLYAADFERLYPEL